MNQGAAVPPVAPAAAAAAAAAAPDAAQDKDAAAAHAADWSDSADNSNSQDDEFLPQAQGPSLSYERKIRLHKYAENRARSCLGLLADSSNALWKVHDCKNDIGVYKPSSDWSESVSAKAVVFANAAFPNVLKTIYDLKTSDKFKLFMRKILGDMFLDAEVLEDLNGTGVYPSANPPRDAREMYKQAAIKWWAIKSGTLASKSSDFYVLEYIGIETSGGDIVACYLFQESLAEVGGMPHIQGNNLERSQFDALICKFERTSSPDYKDDFVTISIAFQRPPPMVSLFRSNPAVEMVTQLARGLRDLLEDPPELQEISVVKTSAWVKDKERRFCVLCNRRFSPIFRRRHHCRTCGEVICWACSSTIRVPSISFTHNDTGKQVLSRHQPSIRVCSKCVVSHHRSKSGRELNNQEDFKDWIQRSTEQQQLAAGVEAGGGVQQLRLPSPSHSQDLSGALETPHDEKEQVPSSKEERMPRKYRRISLDNEDEEKEDGNSRPHQYRERPDTIDDRERRDSNLRTSRKISSGKQRQSNMQLPQRHSYGEQAARGSKHMRRWLDVASDKSQTELSSIGFPRLGSLHPLGTTIDFVSNQMEIDRSIDVNSSSSLCSMQSSDWSKLINMTAVITGINEDGSLSTTSSVASGTNVVLMETSAQSLKTAINKMGAQAVESNKFYIHETIGCLMFLSAGVQALLGHKSMAEMVGAYKDWSGGASLMGMTTFGEIGHLPNSNDFPHYDSLMFGAIIFSKRKRKEYLYF
ncbi:dead deah box rna helicase [Phytophthora cinnamomi]|uniref:dead deah box rna helicase n=1 Tax=Phytophthora cinnamomi TaxID=4785 RepID=UPI0035595BAD|nr:dead deah box rna helicase [Phytophthora cinnamomi]